jgi:GNAT superfamily N-acetyltransferase
MSALTISLEAPPEKATLDIIDKGLDVFNAKFSPEEYSEFVAALKTETGEVKGGIYANAWSGMLSIKWLWIDEAHRGVGHGRALMDAAETEGRRLGCTAVWLDTFEFQARPFYEKLGYELFGTLDFPAGFKRYFMKKAL